MGNNQNGRKSIKQEYIKLIEKRQREYFKKNEAVIFGCDIRKWKEFVLEEIQEAVRAFPDAEWPKVLEESCKFWKTINDNKFRSNIVLFDYIQENKPTSIKDSRVRRTIIKVPENINNESVNFEAASIFDFLNGHFDQPTHFIANMISIFHQFFCSKYESLLEISPEEVANSENATNTSLEPMKELKFFITIVLQSMIYYYGGLLEKKMEQNPNEMYDFILEKVISKEIHDILVHSYNLSNSTDYIRYKQRIESLFGISCSELQIDSYFCLDNKNNTNGYEFPINQLKLIQEMLTPMKKLEIISETTDHICASVDEYWRNAVDIDPSKLVIDGDQFLSIYIYIVIKSGVFDLNSHIWIISQLGRSGLQTGAMGYYLTTLEACLIQIVSMSFDNN